MRKRDRERLEKAQKEMEANSRNRMRWVRSKKSKDLKLDIPAQQMSFPGLPKPRKKRELHWRKHKHNNISWLKNKRIKIVENTKKGEFTISGLNKAELKKVTDVL